jgi:hypothetical protein
MAIAAAEVGFKRFASELHPQNKWLLEELQSPPLYKMLKNYLPKLPVKLNFDGRSFTPKNIRKKIHEANKKRNTLVHRGLSDFDDEELIQILLAVHDLLYLMDYYRGFKWAISHLNLPTSKSISDELKKPK